MDDKYKQIKTRFNELEVLLSSPETAKDTKKIKELSKEYDSLKPAVELVKKLEEIWNLIEQAEKTREEEIDEEMLKVANEEVTALTAQREETEKKLTELLRPKDPRDKKDIIVEIRSGVGGDEAELFAADLFRMYSRFAERMGWKAGIMSADRTSIGGFKEIIFEINGKNVYSSLKYESGVHRVQRIPETEKSGRIHTSTASVAIMPKAKEVEIDIKPEDLKIEAMTASGHGGQSVNTTYSAIRVTHLPTGMVASCQDERSQTQNKLRALEILRARLKTHEEEKRRLERTKERKGQIGMGERSEKIRTYNYPQDRITDHRVKESFHNIVQILDGDLLDIITVLQSAEMSENAK